MTSAKETPQPLPPYVPYRTFLNFVASLRQGMPGRIDRTVMSNMSGAVQSQLFSALRYLKLINEQDVPQEAFERLVSGENAEQKKALKGVLVDAYPFLFDTGNGFSLGNATIGQFEEQFKKLGANGDTVRKCGAFFLAAAKDAEISISPRIAKASRPRTNTTKVRQRGEQPPSRKQNGSAPKVDHSAQSPAPSTVQSNDQTMRTVELRTGGVLTLTITGNILKLDRDDRQFVFSLIDSIEEYEQESENSAESESEDQEGSQHFGS